MHFGREECGNLDLGSGYGSEGYGKHLLWGSMVVFVFFCIYMQLSHCASVVNSVMIAHKWPLSHTVWHLHKD